MKWTLLCIFFLFLFFWREGKTGVLGKTSHGRVKSQQTQPMYDVKDRIEPRPHWWKGECSHPALKLNIAIHWPGQLFRYYSESFLSWHYKLLDSFSIRFDVKQAYLLLLQLTSCWFENCARHIANSRKRYTLQHFRNFSSVITKSKRKLQTS